MVIDLILRTFFKFYLDNYIDYSNSILIVVDNFMQTLFVCGFLIVFRNRNFPENFTASLFENGETNIIV